MGLATPRITLIFGLFGWASAHSRYPNSMNELISKLGIDWRLLIAQIINFLILLGILYKFLYKPVLAMFEKRTATIEKSLEDAKKIEENLMAAEAARDAKIMEARDEGRKIVEKARGLAEAQGAEIVAKSKAAVDAVVKQSKEQIIAEKSKMLEDAKGKISELVFVAVEKVLREKLDEKADKKLIEEALR